MNSNWFDHFFKGFNYRHCYVGGAVLFIHSCLVFGPGGNNVFIEQVFQGQTPAPSSWFVKESFLGVTLGETILRTMMISGDRKIFFAKDL